MVEAQPAWRDRAVSAWRQQGLELRLRQLLDVDIDSTTIETLADGSRVLLDGVTFVLKSGTGTLEVLAPCPRCHKAQNSVAVETMSDIGRAVDSLCRDCEFIVKSGLEQAPAPVQAQGQAAQHPSLARR